MNINATLIGESIAFFFFVWFCMKYVWPPLLGSIEERQKKIEDGLAASDRAEKDLQLAQEKAKHQLKEAKHQAAEIIEQAKKRASQINEEAESKAREEQEKIIAKGHEDVAAERIRIREELRQQLSVLSVQAAEKILQRQIDASTHQEVFDELMTEL